MDGRWMRTLAGAAVLLLLAASASFAAHGGRLQEDKAILLVAFGTSVPEAQKVFDEMDIRVKREFPGVEVRWGYTSRMIRAKLAAQGKRIDSPETALARLMDDGYSRVAVLSLHTIAGEEFHELNRNARLFEQMAGGFERVEIGLPLLSSHEDMVRVAEAMVSGVSAERKPEDGVLLMGHGSRHHPADAAYLAMNQVLQRLDPNVYVGTVEGYPSLDDLLPKLRERKIGKVFLAPFMLVAGDHARNDMAGDDPESWKSILTRNGFACEVVLKGTAEYPEVVDVWLDHLREAFSRL